jgi:hypothetical protein
MVLSNQGPFVICRLSRAHGNEQALCSGSIGIDSFLKVTD